MPERVRLSRAKGYRKPENVVVVSRPSRWGNPFVVGRSRCHHAGKGWREDGPEFVVRHTRKGRPTGPVWAGFNACGAPSEWRATEFAVELFDRMLHGVRVEPDGAVNLRFYLEPLVGHDLACWCPLTDDDGRPWPCHADVLLRAVTWLQWLD